MGANVICTHEWITYTLDLTLISILMQYSLSLLFLHFLLPKTMARQPRISQPVQTQPARMNEIIRRLQADRCTGSIKLCTDTLRADSRLELHVHFCIQAGYHADNPPWGLSPGCTRMQFTRTQTSTISHRREHAHAPARLRERTHAQGHINAPRTRSCTRARACANTRMRTREETGTTY